MKASGKTQDSNSSSSLGLIPVCLQILSRCSVLEAPEVFSCNFNEDSKNSFNSSISLSEKVAQVRAFLHDLLLNPRVILQ